MKHLAGLFCLCLFIHSTAVGNESIRIDFSGATAAANQISVQGAGFGQFPQANVAFGSIPTDNAFEDATDGFGAIVTAAPGEGAMVITQPIQTDRCALIRCSVRLSAAHASLYLSSVDSGENAYVSTLTPNNPVSFVDRYGRIADFFLPPSSGFQGIVQITNTSETEPLTAYLDNFEIVILDKNFIELPVTEITGIEKEPTATPTQTPISGETYTVPLNLPSGVKKLITVKIPAGTFTMGSPLTENGRDSNETQHEVTITNDFYMGMYEVTQAQWQAVMGDNPSDLYGVGDDYPVYQVSWNDCQEFIAKLNQRGIGTFRLPTEAEWEYVCRGGTTTAFYWGDSDSDDMTKQYSWYNENAYEILWTDPHADREGPQPVGLTIPNAFGLFDTSGNVWEWCQDWYGDYSFNESVDPTGQKFGTERVVRGASWSYFSYGLRSAFRFKANPTYRTGDIGFRIVMLRNEE